MNRIQQAIHEIDPDYEIPKGQQREIDRADDPDAIAASLSGLVADLRAQLADRLGLDQRHITAADVLPRIDMSRHITGYGHMHLGWLVRPLDPERLFEIGQQSVAEAQAQADPLTAIYREVLGREPDAGGLANWRGHYEGGMPLSEVIRHIENSPEAQG